MALMTDSRTATLTQWSVLVEADRARPTWSLTTWTKSSMSKALVNSRRTMWREAVIGSRGTTGTLRDQVSIRLGSACQVAYT